VLDVVVRGIAGWYPGRLPRYMAVRSSNARSIFSVDEGRVELEEDPFTSEFTIAGSVV